MIKTISTLLSGNTLLSGAVLAAVSLGIAGCATEPKVTALQGADISGRRDDVETLSRLTSMAIDSAALYREAYERATDGALKDELSRLAAARDQVASTLQLKSQEIGVKPEEKGQPTGARERIFAKIGGAISDKNKSAASDAYESEAAFAKALLDAVNNPYINMDVKAALRSALPHVEQDRYRIQAFARNFGAAV
jgi:uncharacterized protein (TIGR02284 family)